MSNESKIYDGLTDVYKCKSCEFGPCFCGSMFKPKPDMFGDMEVEP